MLSDIERIQEQYRAGDLSLHFDAEETANFRTQQGLYAQADQVLLDIPDQDTFLYRWFFHIAKRKYGDQWNWKPQYQKAGTCAGQSAKLGQDMCLAFMSNLYQFEFPGRCSVAGCYAGGRVDVEGSPGRWEGASVVSMVNWSMKYGCLLLKDLNLPEDATDADEQLALKWANSREGVPKEFESKARKQVLTYCPYVTDARVAGKAIQNGSPLINGTNLIPTGNRDSQGFSKCQQNKGGHATLFWGVRYNPFGLLYQNSWSEEWGKGKVYPEDQPDGSVWITESDANEIISQQQTYVLGRAVYTLSN